MKRISKILVSTLVLLVMLSNISYAVTYSICGMSKTSICNCNMDNNSKDVTSKNVSCCTDKVKIISNNSDFDKEQEKVQNPDITQVVYILTESRNLSNSVTPKPNLLFYITKRDIPVQYSRLII